MAEEIAVMKRKTAITRDRIFLGALVKAYSRPVIEAKISLIASRMYLEVEKASFLVEITSRKNGSSRSRLNPHVERWDRSTTRGLISAWMCLVDIVLHDCVCFELLQKRRGRNNKVDETYQQPKSWQRHLWKTQQWSFSMLRNWFLHDARQDKTIIRRIISQIIYLKKRKVR